MVDTSERNSSVEVLSIFIMRRRIDELILGVMPDCRIIMGKEGY